MRKLTKKLTKLLNIMSNYNVLMLDEDTKKYLPEFYKTTYKDLPEYSEFKKTVRKFIFKNG
jgi:hypothetical protein